MFFVPFFVLFCRLFFSRHKEIIAKPSAGFLDAYDAARTLPSFPRGSGPRPLLFPCAGAAAVLVTGALGFLPVRQHLYFSSIAEGRFLRWKALGSHFFPAALSSIVHIVWLPLFA